MGLGLRFGPQYAHQFLISCSLMDFMYLIMVVSKAEKKLVSFAFVNDTDLGIYGPHVSLSNVCVSMQHSVDHWEGLL